MSTLVHPLVSIEAMAPASTKPVVPPVAVNGVSIGAEIVETFADSVQESTKVERIGSWAQSLTTSEFSDAIKKAKEITDTIDSANGFKKPEGAKGQDCYGPKRQLLNSRMSEAKRIFGVFKQAPDVLKELGYWAAVNKARQWLEEHGKTWDGNKALTKAEKALSQAAKLEGAVYAETARQNPQQMGETIEDYRTRIAGLMAQGVAVAQAQSFEKRVETIVASLMKQFGDEPNALLEACTRILAGEGNKEEKVEETKTE